MGMVVARFCNSLDKKNSPVHIRHHLLLGPIKAELVKICIRLDIHHWFAKSQSLQVRGDTVVSSAIHIPLN